MLELQECENASELNPAFASMIAELVRIPLTTVINEHRQARESLDSVRRTFEQTIHSGLRDTRSDMYSNITMSLESSEESNKNSAYARALETFRMHHARLATLASTLEGGISNILTALNVENLETQLDYAHMLEETLAKEETRLAANATPGEDTTEEAHEATHEEAHPEHHEHPAQVEHVEQVEQPSDTPTESTLSQETPSDTATPETTESTETLVLPEPTETPVEEAAQVVHKSSGSEDTEGLIESTSEGTEQVGVEPEARRSEGVDLEHKDATAEEQHTTPTEEPTATEETTTVEEDNTATTEAATESGTEESSTVDSTTSGEDN